MNDHAPGNGIKLEPNSKPYLLKRIISDGFDTVLVFLLFMTFSALVFSTPLADTYNRHYENYKEVQERVIEEYGDNAGAINEILGNDGYYRDERFAANLHGYILKLTAGIISEAIVLLFVPLLSPERATPGKILMRLMPYCERKRTRATRASVLGRFIFVLVIDSALFYLLTGVLTFLLIPVIRLIEMLLNKKNKTVCDVLSGVMIIEQLSYDGIDNF